ncbi:MAG: ATP-dependent helicase [Muribaculaceae bacterium]|nr:ATP-dependent helicase [Muribaculaceae bacterium]MDE6752984.1 ATP-dependent helicase [Muribaculaceae bacterium]
MSKVNLSKKQNEVVVFDKGPLLVKAAAGSGKTRVLTERICSLAQKTKRKILAITFTNQASEEIRSRLSEIDEDLLNKVFVGTFHSFCAMVLENHGASIGLVEMPQVFSDMQDRLRILENAIYNTPSLKTKFVMMDNKEKQTLKIKALDAISWIKRDAVLDDQLEEYLGNDGEDLMSLYFAYRDILGSQNAIDFDDLLWYSYNLFITNHNIASLYSRSYEYICVDEAQDLNRVQYFVLRSMTFGRNNNIMLVGDPNQSIYGFNGSSADLMQKDFVKDYSPTIIILSDNYRSTKSILQFANKIIPGSASLDNIVLNGICEETQYNTVEQEAQSVVKKISNLISLRNCDEIEDVISYTNFAILARNKYVLQAVENVLSSHDIPYYYKTTSSGIEFNSQSGKAFFLGILVKANPKDSFHFSQLKDLLELKSCAQGFNELMHEFPANSIQHAILDCLILLKDNGDNFKICLDHIIKRIEAQDFEDSEEELNNAYEDFTELREHWHRYSKSSSERSLSSFRNAVALGQTSIRRQEEGIALSTVHTMKGQEKDIVFLIGMDDQTFPDYRAIQKGGFEMLQEKNNLYVAVTRARRYLFISYPLERVMPWGAVKSRLRSRLLP